MPVERGPALHVSEWLVRSRVELEAQGHTFGGIEAEHGLLALAAGVLVFARAAGDGALDRNADIGQLIALHYQRLITKLVAEVVELGRDHHRAARGRRALADEVAAAGPFADDLVGE